MLSGSSSSISIICEHFLFVCIVKTKANIKVCGFSKQFCCRLTFEIWIIHKPSLGTCKVPHKFGPDRFRRLDVYWIQTNKHPNQQTNKQTSQIYIQKIQILAWEPALPRVLVVTSPVFPRLVLNYDLALFHYKSEPPQLRISNPS